MESAKISKETLKQTLHRLMPDTIKVLHSVPGAEDKIKKALALIWREHQCTYKETTTELLIELPVN